MNKLILPFSFGITILIILFISLANMTGEWGYFVFYNILYGILLSTLVPLYLMHKENKGFSSVGIKKFGVREYIVLICFILFSVGGQLIPLFIEGVNIRFDLLPICILPLIMTTFFEEFLFRGFIQTRIQERYGWIAAIVLSGLLFSIYHLGYPGFRSIEDLAILFVVGIGFALAYKLSGNNLIVSYLVNLPNALLTYILKSEQFPPFTNRTSVFAGVTILTIIAIFVYAKRKYGIHKLIKTTPCSQ